MPEVAGNDRVWLLTQRSYEGPSAFLVDGEVVVSDKRGIADFERLHSREHDESATLLAFDLLELNGKDLSHLPLDERKSELAKLLKRSCHSSIALNERLEAEGTRAFVHARMLGFEGIVSKRRVSRYVSGRSKTWVKVKNPNAVQRV